MANLQPKFQYVKNDPRADFYCNCPNCESIVGKIDYSIKYDDGIALFGYKTCKTCQEPIDWKNIIDRFQIKSNSSFDLEYEGKTLLGTKEPVKPANRMDKCMAILKSLMEGSKEYLTVEEPKTETKAESKKEKPVTAKKSADKPKIKINTKTAEVKEETLLHEEIER